MNFDRISFRTSPEERAFLEKINQRYRCSTITGLMRKLLDEVMAKESVLLQSGLVVREEASSNAAIPVQPKIKMDGRLVLKDTRTEAEVPIQYLADTKKVVSHTDNPFFVYLQDIFWFEQARQELERLWH